MKTKLLLTILLAIFFLNINAQTTFQKTYGGGNDDGYSVQQTTDGGYVIAGRTASFGPGNWGVYLIKTDGNGDTLWTKTFGGASSDYARSVRQTTDGGYVIAGSTGSFGSGYSDVYLIKTDGSGNTLWSKSFGGTGNDDALSVQQTTDGGYVIAGRTGSFGAGDGDVYLIKTDANGDSLWTKTFGGTGDDYGHSVQQTTDGGYVIAGNTQSFDYDFCLIKTDANGDTLWTKTFGGTGDDEATSVQQSTDGGYVMAGITSSFGVANGSVYLIKTDANGDSLWTKTFGGTFYDMVTSVQQSTDGGYVMAGITASFGTGGSLDVYLIKTDGNGNALWSKTFGGTGGDYGHSIQQTTDGGYVMAGITGSFGGAGNYYVYLIKTDGNGNSGCNESNANTIVTTPPTVVTNTATQVSSGGIVGNPATLTGSGAVVATLCTTVGINENNLTDNFVNIFPNPFSTQTTLKADKFFKDATLIVYNSFGQTVKQIKNINGQTVTLSRDNLPSGLYFVRLTEENKTIAVDKLVITD